MPAVKKLFFGSGQRPLRQQLAITLGNTLAFDSYFDFIAEHSVRLAARQLIDQRAAFFMDAMLSVREYTSKKVNPFLLLSIKELACFGGCSQLLRSDGGWTAQET